MLGAAQKKKKALLCNSLLRNYNIPIQDEYFLAKSLDPDQNRLYNSENLSPEVIKLFLCSTQLSREFTTRDSLYKIIFERPCTVTTKD